MILRPKTAVRVANSLDPDRTPQSATLFAQAFLSEYLEQIRLAISQRDTVFVRILRVNTIESLL